MSELSTGGIVGIVIGVLLLTIMICIAFWYKFARKQRNKESSSGDPIPTTNKYDGNPNASATNILSSRERSSSGDEGDEEGDYDPNFIAMQAKAVKANLARRGADLDLSKPADPDNENPAS